MDDSTFSEIIWVDQPSALRKMVDDLARCRYVAVDTESNSLYAYQEQVCLIQFSTGDQDYLVDPLAIRDLSSLEPLFSSPDIEKIFHAAEYDIICLKRDFGFSFANIFDTMLAGRILKFDQIGLAAMLETEYGIVLDKRFQRANWAERPLSEEQKAYARLDTHYLIDLRGRLYDALQEKGLVDLAREDFDRMTRVRATTLEDDSAHFWKLAYKQNMDQKQLTVLYELYQYRDRVARSRNRPVFKILGDKTLLEIADKLPADREALLKTFGMNQRMVSMHGGEILAAVKRGLTGKPPQRPIRRQPNGRYINLHEALRMWRKVTAQKLGIESDVVLPRDVMETIAKENPLDRKALKAVMSELPWRFEEYADEILGVIQSQETS